MTPGLGTTAMFSNKVSIRLLIETVLCSIIFSLPNKMIGNYNLYDAVQQ